MNLVRHYASIALLAISCTPLQGMLITLAVLSSLKPTTQTSAHNSDTSAKILPGYSLLQDLFDPHYEIPFYITPTMQSLESYKKPPLSLAHQLRLLYYGIQLWNTTKYQTHLNKQLSIKARGGWLREVEILLDGGAEITNQYLDSAEKPLLTDLFKRNPRTQELNRLPEKLLVFSTLLDAGFDVCLINYSQQLPMLSEQQKQVIAALLQNKVEKKVLLIQQALEEHITNTNDADSSRTQVAQPISKIIGEYLFCQSCL